jgi:hypothetical protein
MLSIAAHSIFLLVVDCRTECTASIATRLVLDHKIEDQTIGIFTKMDIFSNEYEDSDESKQDLFLSYMDPKNAGEFIIYIILLKLITQELVAFIVYFNFSMKCLFA